MGQIERRNKIVPIMERFVKDDMSFDKFLIGVSYDSFSLIHFVTIFENTFSPLVVTVRAARSHTFPTNKRGALVQDLDTGEKSRCSIGLNLEQ